MADAVTAHEKSPILKESFVLSGADEEAWTDVVQKMDEVFGDLVRSQTEVEQKNARLEETQTFIHSILDAMSDLLIVCDSRGRIQQVNPAFLTATGWKPADLEGQVVPQVFDTASREAVEDMVVQLCSDRKATQIEASLDIADGSSALLSVNCTPRRDHRGRLVGMVFVGRPIGELQKAYRELEEAHQELTQTQERLLVSEKMAALGRLVAGVAHELNNPISFVFANMYALKRYGNAIVKYLDACNEGTNPIEMAQLRKELKIERIMQDIGPLVDGTLEGAERVRDIVQDLRRFSGNQEENSEQLNLTRLVRTAADWVIKTQRVKPELCIEMPEKLEMQGRKGQLHQILVNLVQNAADMLADSDDGRITISARHEGGDIVIDVADNGGGIPPAILDKIFEPFFTTKPIGAGTGLGLYVSYTIAIKQGGDLVAANLPEGGALFTLRLPTGEHANS